MAHPLDALGVGDSITFSYGGSVFTEVGRTS
jgi:hypothetical protein